MSFFNHTSPRPSSDSESIGPHERREAGAQIDGGVGFHREQIGVAPEAERPAAIFSRVTDALIAS